MANHRLPEGQSYKGRNPNVSIFNVTITREIHDMIRQYAPNRRAMGRFVEDLVLRHHAKEEARRELKAELA